MNKQEKAFISSYPDDTSYIKSRVELEEDGYINCSFYIHDGSETVRWYEFLYDDEESYYAHLEMINHLVYELDVYRTFLKKAWEDKDKKNESAN